MKKLLVILPILLAGCSSQQEVEIPEEIASLENLTVFPADTDPQHEISLIKEVSYGDVDDILLGDWLSFHVDHLGRVFLADHRETVLHLYNPDGTYNRQISREGDGPGEYRRIGQMRTNEQYFYLMDRNLRRITRYDINTFEVVSDLTVPSYPDENNERERGTFYSSNSFFLMNDHQYLVRFGMGFWHGGDGSDDDSRKMKGRILNPEDESYDPEDLFTFPESEMLVSRREGGLSVMPVPYKRNSVVTYHNGNIYHGWSEDFLLKIYDSEGNYQRAIYYPYSNLPLNRDAVLEIYKDRGQSWRDMVRNDNMPETWPVFYGFTVDDENRIWVEMITEDPEESEYVVLDEDGTLLGRIPWTRDKTIEQVKDGSVYTLEEDEMGLREVVKYRLEFI